MNWDRSPLAAVVGLCLALLPRTAYSQLGDTGKISTSNYAVDLYQGAVLASTRVVGMGGAYVAIAEGVEGSFYNPAAPAVRVAWSRKHTDYDVGAGMTFPWTLRSSDFFNSGADRTNLTTSSSKEFVFLDGEAQLQVGPWGVGAGVALQQYGLTRDTAVASSAQTDRLRAQFLTALIQTARSTADGQLVVGVGVRPTALSVVDQNPAQGQPATLFSTVGVGYSLGFLWRPTDAIIRVGASFNSAVTTRVSTSNTIQPDSNGNLVIAGETEDEMYLPKRVGRPWSLNLGVATQLGARPFNPRWVDPNELLHATRRRLEWRAVERQRNTVRVLELARSNGGDLDRIRTTLEDQEHLAKLDDEAEFARAARHADDELRLRYQKLGRWYVLIATSLQVDGPVRDAVGIESFLQRYVDRSGRRTVVSPRFGVESEVISGWLKLRCGAYGEPTRFDNANSAPRIHTTFGFEERLFKWSVFGLLEEGTSWRVHGAMDLADRYFGWSGSLGLWH